MDNIAAGVTCFDELIHTLTKTFDCLRASCLTPSAHKSELRTTKIDYLGNTMTPAGITPESDKVKNFLDKIRMPDTVRLVKRLIGFVQCFRNFIPDLDEKLLPFYKLLRKDTDFIISNAHTEALEAWKMDLINATNLTLRLPKPGLQYVLFCDASYHSTGFVLMTEDYLVDQKGQHKKMYAPVSFCSRLFNDTQLNFSVCY